MTKLSPPSTLSIHFETFAYLAAAIAASSCVREPSPTPQPSPPAAQVTVASVPNAVPVVAIAEPPPPPPDDDGREEPAPALAPAPEPPTPPSMGCDNQEGTVSCDFIDPRTFVGPDCEGFAHNCRLLGNAYLPRVAAAVARCFEQKGRAACGMWARTACYRAALQEACPNPAYRVPCEATVKRCHQRHRRPDFTVAECVQALSSVQGAELAWALSAMGPTAEGCRLAFPVY